MKKTYQKPRIMIEEFSASEIIATASGCGAVVTLMESGSQCTSDNSFIAEAFAVGFFSDKCETPYSYEEYDGICLHGPADNEIYTS